MPDLLTHYTVSYLVLVRVFSLKKALALSLIGLLPDIDVVLGVHRWSTHSLLLAGATALPIMLAAAHLKHRYLAQIVALTTVYLMHIAMDLLTAPTPVLYPLLHQAHTLRIHITGALSSSNTPKLLPTVKLETTPIDFTPKTYLEGPIASDLGIAIAIAAAIATLVEYIAKTQYKYTSRNS